MNACEPTLEHAGKSLVYVYGVGRLPLGRDSAALPSQGIIPDAAVTRLVHGDLVAFASTVPASQFGASELRAALADNAWLRDRVLAHEKILEELHASYPFVPFRFCTIYHGLAHVSDALERHQAELNEALDRVRDASEWGVKLFCQPDVLRQRVESASVAIGQMRETLARATPGARFFLQKKFDRALAAEVTEAISRRIVESQSRLAVIAREGVSLAVQARAEHGRPADMVWNAAYLVGEEILDAFRQALAVLMAESAEHGFSYDLTGPWPPYHFVTRGEEGIADAARCGQSG